MKFLLPFLVLGACVTADEEPTNVISLEVDSSNGTSLNGTSLNGTSLNGTSLNGTSLNGTSLNGTSLVGSSWSGTTSNSATVKLRIDKATQGTGTNNDIWFYSVSFQTSTGWSPLCGVDAAGIAVQAIAVPGVWTGTANNYASSTTQFTWACRAKTVAKCIELGYKPWKSLSNQLASCVRLLRADYCGTGVSYTKDGTLLNLYDNVGVQADAEAWDLEAGWGPNGAVCLSKAADTRFGVFGFGKPPCYSALKAKTGCGFSNGAYILDELSPNL